MLLSCQNISKSFGVTTILKDVNFLLNEKDKVAIVGVNGAGKTTLFKIITGELTPDVGELIISKNCTLGYLSQIASLNLENTIYEEMLTVFKTVIELEEQIRLLEIDMGVADGETLDSHLKSYTMLSQKFEDLKGYEYKSRIKGIIKGLGFGEEDFNTPIKALSGGQKTRISLGKTLLTEPDLLLLDEPTNHLDITSIEWLENFLRNYNKGVLIISHDRYFLNNIIDKVIEIEHKKATIYFGNYSHFVKKKEETKELQTKHYLNQQKEIKKQEESIRKLKSYNREKSIKRAESKEKLLDKIEVLDKPDETPETMRLIFEPKKQSGFDVLKVESLEKSFNTLLFKNVSFEIMKGEKVALLGVNGVGKTTLIKILMGLDSETKGNFKLGTGVNIAFYSQEQENLNFENSIIEEISDVHPTLTTLEVRNALASFMFTSEDVNKKILNLSGGEKGRIAFVKIMLSECNFLILDEPTNHLDMASKEILEKALQNYKGTVLYISHDRYFINNTAEKVLELTQNGMATYVGNYDYYIEKKSQFIINEITENEVLVTESKDNWLKKKDDEAQLRKDANRLVKIEKDIANIEQSIQQLDVELSLPELSSDVEKLQTIYSSKDKFEAELEKLYLEWEQLN
jgi:ATP-binding cassette, subfamily F, member 3